MSAGDPASSVLPGSHHAGVARVFGIIARRSIRKSFHALRATPGSADLLRGVATTDRPVICCVTHTSWWDAMLGFALHTMLMPERQACAPIDRAVLENLKIFRRLGLFGIDPDDPGSFDAVVRYATAQLGRDALPTLWITPQGRFQDPREAMVVRPGAAAIAAGVRTPSVFAIAAEYVFWDDKKPEMLVHVRAVEAPESADSMRGWHREIRGAMREAADELAQLAIERDAEAFESLLGGGSGGTFAPYDWFLRLTGRDTGAIRTRARERAPRASEGHGRDPDPLLTQGARQSGGDS